MRVVLSQDPKVDHVDPVSSRCRFLVKDALPDSQQQEQDKQKPEEGAHRGGEPRGETEPGRKPALLL